MSRKEKRAKAITIKEWQERKRKAQEVKEWAREIALLVGGCALCYGIMWLIGAVAFVL